MSIGQAEGSAASLPQVHLTTLAHIADTDALPEDLDWLPLRQAILEHIRSLLSSWPTSEVELHKAASLLPGDGEAAAAAAPSAPPAASEAPAAPVTLAERFVSASTPTPAATAGEAPAAPNDENAPPAPAADLSASISVSTEDSVDLDAQQKEHMEMAAAWGIKPGDEQHFYPSKRRAPAEAPWLGSWGRAPVGEALEEEIKEIERGLEAFEAPPFTMQRLAELILAPLESARTPGKYLSALRRCLAVTATHASFTSLPVDDSAAPPTNGFISSGAAGYDVTAPSTAPLFSPIPFLTTRPDDVPDEEVPGMELGGADRTTEEASIEAGISGAGRAGAAPGTAGALAEAPASTGTTDAPTQGAAQPVPVVAPAPNVPHGATAPLVPVEPLGVPAGKIDEVDELPHAGSSRPIVPLSSTTSAAAASASASTDSATASTAAATADDKAAGAAPDGGRATKRSKPESDGDVLMTDKAEEAAPAQAAATSASAPEVAKAVVDDLDERAQFADAD